MKTLNFPLHLLPVVQEIMVNNISEDNDEFYGKIVFGKESFVVVYDGNKFSDQQILKFGFLIGQKKKS